MVTIELEGEKFSLEKVWAPAWARLESKILALQVRVEDTVRRAESRGEELPDQSGRGRAAAPLASFSEEGKLIWNDELVDKIKELAKPKKPRQAECTFQR